MGSIVMHYCTQYCMCRHGMLASNAAERLQAEGTLRAQNDSLLGEVAMLSQAKEGLALRVAQLTSSLGVADSLAESRLKECQTAVLQACTSIICACALDASNTRAPQKGHRVYPTDCRVYPLLRSHSEPTIFRHKDLKRLLRPRTRSSARKQSCLAHSGQKYNSSSRNSAP